MKKVSIDRVEYYNDQGKLHREDGPAVEFNNGGKLWYINGKKHRDDGPAVEYLHGTRYWYINDKLHRTDGPAVEFNGIDRSEHDKPTTIKNYNNYWYINGKKHREDGPAVEYSRGSKEYFLSGIKYEKDQYENEIIKIKLKRLVEL